MKIVLVTVWFSEKMGYIENCLPKALTFLGHEVHVISSTAQVNYNDPIYNETFSKFLGPAIVSECKKEFNGYTLYRLPFKVVQRKIIIKGLNELIHEIKPDIVQTFDPIAFVNLQLVHAKFYTKFKLFTANHTTFSVFPLLTEKYGLVKRFGFWLTRTFPSMIQNKFVERSYPATIDCEALSLKYYGLPKEKSLVLPLGVDTILFHPIINEQDTKERLQIRNEFGYSDNDIVCIYTGKFTKGKNPLCLAKAIEMLNNKNESFKGLFFGDGEQIDEIKKIKNCKVFSYVPFFELDKFYRASDIGVWPTQESTSMLDAAACGLPIVISNTVKAKERVDGNGLTYLENNATDLCDALLKLKDKKLREKLGNNGIIKIRDNYSWIKMANLREDDYMKFI